MALIFDLETNGLIPEVSVIHCLVIRDTETKLTDAYVDNLTLVNSAIITGTISEGLARLKTADHVIGHNIVNYDLAVIRRLTGIIVTGQVTDTIILSRLLYGDMRNEDFIKARKKHGKWIPQKFFGRHSLEAWGHRLGNYKGDFEGPWTQLTQEMLDYCIQDVDVTAELYKLLSGKPLDPRALTLEHQVASIIQRQVEVGFEFDVEEATKLYAVLAAKREELSNKLRTTFGNFYLRDGKTFTPKRDNVKSGYTKDCQITKIKLVEFNPGSRMHIANRLSRQYGWVPTEFTNKGEVKIDETVLAALTYPPCQLLTEYLTLDKRIGQLAEGDKAWLKLVRNGRIHGSVNTNGAVTGRMLHSDPNVAQTPKVGVPYGKECRTLYKAKDGYALVGCDAEGLELRCLSHFMALYDGGAYATAVVKGTKEEGTDVHTINKKVIGLNTRDAAKTWCYAFNKIEALQGNL